jgi:hypothetical protein
VVQLPDGGCPRFLRSLRNLIDARSVECTEITDDCDAWLDEDGSATGRPVNRAATRIAHAYGAPFTFHGPVVILGYGRACPIVLDTRHKHLAAAVVSTPTVVRSARRRQYREHAGWQARLPRPAIECPLPR